MEGSSGSRNRERMIGTRGKIDAGRGIDLFRSGEPMEHSRDDETAEDARCRRKITQENAGECRRTRGNAGERRRTQGEHRVTRDAEVTRRGRRMQGRCRVTRGRRSDSGTGREVIEGVS